MSNLLDVLQADGHTVLHLNQIWIRGIVGWDHAKMILIMTLQITLQMLMFSTSPETQVMWEVQTITDTVPM
jgi:hypothetical protein